MKLTHTKSFKADSAWGSELIALFGDISVRAHWTDQPYRWHKNTGREVFMVVDGTVDMHYRENGKEEMMTLQAGDALTIEDGEEHVAHPRGEARILVIENIYSE
ncbi:cupin domain-containing protein [Marinicaulis aureus]|uniref:Cupin domain-containing protein n=1 Tax=Hyphococcus aureus TaxID=2666033 RepID=A0ABW1KVD5_9PROT